MENSSALLEELKKAIDHWVQSKKSRSLSLLAHRTNKAYSTIRYIAQGERLPNESTIFAITDVVMETSDRIRFFKTYFPAIGEMMEKAYDREVRENPHHQHLRMFLQREPHNRIFNMAATNTGTSRQAIRMLLGDVGIQALNEIIESGILRENDRGAVTYESTSWALTNPDDVLTQISASLGQFDRSLLGTDGAALINMTGAVNSETLTKIKALIVQFAQDLSAIKNAPSAAGPIPFYCNLLYSLYDRNQWKQGKDEQQYD